MPFASGLSEHPVAAHAVGEAVGQVLDVLDTSPDLAVLFVTAPHVGAMEDIAAAVRDLLRPQVLLGVTASSVVGGAREVDTVDVAPAALALAEASWSLNQLEAPHRTHARDVPELLEEARARGLRWDLIVADPPYAKQPGDRDFTPELLGEPALRRALKSGGIFVLEHLPGADLTKGAGWECVRRKRYGATEVSFLKPLKDEGEPA